MDSKNLLLAAAIAGLALSANAEEKTKEAKPSKASQDIQGQCSGVNSCKGTSACHSEANSCAGTNSCKGKGWLKMSQKDCKAKKGVFKKEA